MSYYLIWNKEVIEEDIKTLKDAEFLQIEYSLAYGGTVTIKKGVQE